MILVAISMIAVSCGESVQSTAVEKSVDVAANSEVDLKIEGMMCEVNCAGKIKEEVKSMPGVADCEIDFESKTAHVKFDNQSTSKEDITAAIEKVNDGAYKVVTEEKENVEVEEEESTTSEENDEVNISATDVLKVSNLIGLLTSIVFDIQ